MGEWHPIKNAPKDGTSILVTMAGGTDGPYYVLFWNGNYFEDASSGDGPSMDHLTHWMSLPAPPHPRSPVRIADEVAIAVDCESGRVWEPRSPKESAALRAEEL